MFSLSNTFRSLARLTPRRVSAAPFSATASASDQPSDEYLQGISELGNMLNETLTSTPADVPSPTPSHPSGPNLARAIKPNSFIRPRDLTEKGLQPPRTFRKRPYLGPDNPVARRGDVFHQLQIDPLNECLNDRLMSAFVTDMGKIMSRAETNLTWRSQRRLGKAIRRARQMGVIPTMSKIRYQSYNFY